MWIISPFMPANWAKSISFALLLVPSVRDNVKVLSQDVWLPYSSPTFGYIITQSNPSFKQGHLSRTKSMLRFWIFLALPTKTLCDLSVLGDVHCGGKFLCFKESFLYLSLPVTSFSATEGSGSVFTLSLHLVFVLVLLVKTKMKKAVEYLNLFRLCCQQVLCPVEQQAHAFYSLPSLSFQICLKLTQVFSNFFWVELPSAVFKVCAV